MESPYQELTQFDLLKKAQELRDSQIEQIRQEHPDFSDAQIDMVLNGQMATADTTNDYVADPILRRWMAEKAMTTPTAPRRVAAATNAPAYKWPQQDINKASTYEATAKDLLLSAYSPGRQTTETNLLNLAVQYTQAANDIEDRNAAAASAILDKSKPATESVPVIQSMDDLRALTSGDKFYTKGLKGYADDHLYQKTGLSSDAQAQADAMVVAYRGGKPFSAVPATPIDNSQPYVSEMTGANAPPNMVISGQYSKFIPPADGGADQLPDMTGVPVAAPVGIRVRNKKTGQLGTKLQDGTIIPDPVK